MGIVAGSNETLCERLDPAKRRRVGRTVKGEEEEDWFKKMGVFIARSASGRKTLWGFPHASDNRHLTKHTGLRPWSLNGRQLRRERLLRKVKRNGLLTHGT